MIKQFRLGISGILMSISTFVILMLLNRNYDSLEILQYFKVNSVIITTDTFIACVARGKFMIKIGILKD